MAGSADTLSFIRRITRRAFGLVNVSAEDIALLNLLQKDFPLTRRPFTAIARRLGRTEAGIIERLAALQEAGVISRLGAVFNHEKAGASTLVAMAVPECEIDAVAASISALPQVNHNYLREDHYNLWFVVTAPGREEIDDVLAALRRRPGHPMLDLPMEKGYHIDLGFPLC
jgi:DNA-binding Lrp family transcriptional regulator